MAVLKKHTRSLVLGGLFFMIPLLLIIVAFGKIIQILRPLGTWLSKVAGLHSIFGKASVLMACIILILLICYISGFLIQKGFVRKWSDNVEEKLFTFFPSLQMFKFRLLGEQKDVIHDFWQAILLKDENSYSIAFITESTQEFLTLYIPDAPRLDAGEVRYVRKDTVEYQKISMKNAMESLYAFGKGMAIEEKINA